MREGNLCSLEKRVVLITGAGSGIGRATALLALDLGAKVAAADISEESLASLRQEAGDKANRLFCLAMDVTDPASITAGVAAAKEKHGLITGLFCAAGTTIEQPFLEAPIELWQRIIQLNLYGTVLVAKAVIGDLVTGNAKGSVVTVASTQGVVGRANGAHYSASKGAIISFTRSIALEFASKGIRVNSVAPGAVDTPLLTAALAHIEGGMERARSLTPLGRFGKPEELAATVCFLLSDAASWTTGQTVHVNGGYYLG